MLILFEAERKATICWKKSMVNLQESSMFAFSSDVSERNSPLFAARAYLPSAKKETVIMESAPHGISSSVVSLSPERWTYRFRFTLRMQTLRTTQFHEEKNFAKKREEKKFQNSSQLTGDASRVEQPTDDQPSAPWYTHPENHCCLQHSNHVRFSRPSAHLLEPRWTAPHLLPERPHRQETFRPL